jgi:hypothetical protein
MWEAAFKKKASNSSPLSTFILQTEVFVQPHKQKSDGSSEEQCGPNSNSSISANIQN